jgi:hypothetical protein
MEAALLALVIGGEHVAAPGSPAAGTYVYARNASK